MTFPDTLTMIDTELATGLSGPLTIEQLKFIERWLSALGEFPGRLGEAVIQFREALLHHALCTARGDEDEAGLTYAYVCEMWEALRPQLEDFDLRVGETVLA
jgi:hypothetical protein